MSCMNNEPKKKSAFADEWFGAGIALGVAFGIIFENLGLWLPIGRVHRAGGACLEEKNE